MSVLTLTTSCWDGQSSIIPCPDILFFVGRYFGLTLTFILLPSLTMTGFSFRWYLMDADNAELERVPLWKWVVRLAVLMLQVRVLSCNLMIQFL